MRAPEDFEGLRSPKNLIFQNSQIKVFIYFSKYETIVSEMACALDIQNGLASRGGLGDDTQKACFQSGVI